MSKLKNKKISENLLRLVKPYIKVVEDSHNHREQRLTSLLAVGTTAWNISVTKKTELKDIILRPINNKEELFEMEKMIDNLVQRKYNLFSDDDRIILNCKVNLVKRKKYDITVSFLYKDEYEKKLANSQGKD